VSPPFSDFFELDDDFFELEPELFFEEEPLVEPDFLLPDVLLLDDLVVLLFVLVDEAVLFVHEVQNAMLARSATVEMRDRFIVV
jgi:hypothetical protein